MGTFSAIVDMGTTNTRLTVVDRSGEVYASAKGEFGVKDCASTGSKEILIKGLNRLIETIQERKNVSLDQIERMIGVGMITSDIGLLDVPHRIAPVALEDLAAHVQETSIRDIPLSPILFIPGIKNRVENLSWGSLGEMDFMRGEETQVFGAINLYEIQVPVTFMFLTSHTKLIDVDEQCRITRSFTTMSGQMFDALRVHSFLASSLPGQNPSGIHQEALLRGVEMGLEVGILRAGLMVRFMHILMHTSPEERFSFLEGIIIGSDIQAIRNGYPFMRRRLVILGDRLRSEAYRLAFHAFLDRSIESIGLEEASLERATLHGALRIAERYLSSASAPPGSPPSAVHS
jgi:2-dehydro-3-deoxygalactonokinase